MATIKIIGTAHSESFDAMYQRNILSEQADVLFMARYGKMIDSHTLIISEGQLDSTVVKSSHPNYVKKLAKISPLLASNGYTPDILLSDYRNSFNPSRFLQYGNQLQRLQKLGKEYINQMRFHRPESMVEALHMILNDQCDFSLNVDSSPETIKLCQELLEIENKTDSFFIDRARQYQNDYKNIFIVVGSVHALSIAKDTRWELQVMENPLNFQAMMITTMCYILLREFPKALVKK
ncbi:MAG TPA: hypothetical protein VL576_00775 [Candidatus Paceibacterota bacterium]|jgi:secreted Zn-dependent insulinase-like peptidase|nr:hypothetical protein [Candidatus Paceibacterota bacterium]